MKKYLLSLLFSLWLITSGFSQTVTNVGTDFWIAFPPNYDITATIQLFISSELPASGSVFSAFPGVNQNFTVTPGIVTQLNLPSAVELQGGIENKGIHITTDNPVSIYGLNFHGASTDAYMALPVNALGLDYRIITYKTNAGSQGSSFSIVGTQDATALTIFNHQTNSTTNINLNMGQTYHVFASTIGQDVTGSRIQSNLPVAVFGSVSIGYVPSISCQAADHMVEQMFPWYSWGKNFVTVPLAGRDNSGDVFRIVAGEDGTDISVNGTLVSTINTGDYYETNLAGYNSITTSKATILAQFAKGMYCTGSITGDPFMMLIPPREQFLTNYTIVSIAGFSTQWVNVVAPDYALGTIYQDGVLIPNGVFTQISTTNYYGAQRSVTAGSHTFTSTFPFGVFVYGWGNVNSYGYPGGCSLSPVGTVNSVTLTPDTAYGQLNVTSVCLTANVLDNLANPVVGVLVNFHISGLNPLTGNGYTDAFGNAQYCYTQTGVVAGEDHIYAEVFGFKSDTSVVFWSYTPPCSDPTNGGTIGNDQNGCGNYIPTTLNNILIPSGYTGTLEYKWQQSIISNTTGFTDILNTNSASYSPGPLTQTTWFKRLARVNCMSDWGGAVESNPIEITVMPLLPVGVSISASAQSVCSGTSVTFTASPTNGGSSPSYQWKVNGINVGTNSSTYTYNPASGDLVSCILTSNVLCPTGNPSTSNTISMIVTPILAVSVSISASANPVCSGIPVTFTVTTVNGGATPNRQWKVNGINVGANNSTYQYTPAEGDIISCILISSLSCTIGNPATSNSITMNVNTSPVVTFTICNDSITTTNAKPFKLKGGIPLGGTYYGPGVTNNILNPAIAGVGTKTISYTYTNAALCTVSDYLQVVIRNPSFVICGSLLTDIRDNRVYQTVQIGSQCWMAEDLNYGIEIPANMVQRDNCIPEKFHNPASSIQHPASVYQWDEIMNWDETVSNQGLCPPGWHVPSESDWNTLFTNYINNGFAANPLKYSGFSGFYALLSGTRHMNKTWDWPGFATFFWSSTAHGTLKAWSHGMNDTDPSVSLYPALKSNAFSVRCLKD